MSTRRKLLIIAAVVALAVISVLSLAIGSRSVSLSHVWAALTDPQASGIEVEAVRLRGARTVLGILLGVSLATAGALLQAVTRNPLADPSILGLNAGAAFAVVASIAVFGLTTPLQYMGAALIGGALAAGLVWWIASSGRLGPTAFKLTLAGAVMGSMLSSLTTAVLLPRIDVISNYRFWMVGGLSGARFSTLLPMLPLLLGGLLLAVMAIPGLNALALGDELTVGLGGSLTRIRLVSWAAAVLLCAVSTSLAGPIGFVGLVIPHAARLIVGSDYRKIIALGALLGPLLLLGADVLGRFITRPADVEVGILTAIIGAPAFVALVRAKGSRGLA